jgi:hypothetical protein
MIRNLLGLLTVPTALALGLVINRLVLHGAPATEPAPVADAGASEPAEAAVAGASDAVVGDDDLAVVPASATERPVVMAEQTAIDAGEVVRGDPLHYAFVLKNTGTAPLEVRAKASCQCTVARYDRTIVPGAEGKVEAELRTASLNGKVHKTIAVRTNDPQQPKLELKLAATIRPVVEVLPAGPQRLTLASGAPTVQRFTLQVRDADPVEVRAATCSVPYATAAVEPLPGAQAHDRDYQLTLTVSPEAPLGRSNLVVNVQTTSPREPSVAIKVACEKGILALPSSVSFGAAAANATEPIQRVVLLTKRAGPFQVRKVRGSDPNLEVRPEPAADGSQVRLYLSYRAGAAAKKGLVFVETDDPEQPVVAIPVR